MDRQEPQNLSPEQQKYAQELSNEVEKLLLSHYPIEKIAELVGGSDYITIVSRGSSLAKEFNVKRWVADTARANIQLQFPSDIEQRKEVFIPPDELEREVGTGEGEYTEPDHIPRTRYLMEVLADERISYKLVEGENTSTMRRGQSYVVFLMAERKKAAFVNNEEGNASFIVHQLDDVKDWELYAAHTKQELKGRDDVSVIIWPGAADQWKELLRMHLQSEYVPRGRNDSDELASERPVTREQSEREEAPEGWVTVKTLAKLAGVAPQTIRAEMEQYRSGNPNWFHNYIGVGRQFTEHLHPELVEALTVLFDSRERAPEGWLTNKGLASELGVAKPTVRRRALRYKTEHPDWFKLYRDPYNREFEHYHPNLVELLRVELERPTTAPEGWMTRDELRRDLSTGWATMSEVVERYTNEHSEWVKQYLGTSGRVVDFLHPDLVAKIREDLEK